MPEVVDESSDAVKVLVVNDDYAGRYEVCVRLRSDPGTQDAPIVVRTGSFSEPADTRFADSLGVEAFLVKPFELDVLLAEARRLAGGPSRPHEVLEPEDTGLAPDRLTHSLGKSVTAEVPSEGAR